MLAKFWLNPVELASSVGFGAPDLNAVRKLVEENAPEFQEAWDELFLLGEGEGIHWPALDEDLSVAGLLAGHRSRSRPLKRAS